MPPPSKTKFFIVPGGTGLFCPKDGFVSDDMLIINIKETALIDCIESLFINYNLIHNRSESYKSDLVLADSKRVIEDRDDLISNAIKHHDKTNGEICIACHEENDIIKFSITDDGPGIPFRNQTKIFELFEGSNLPKADSTGIGLTIVQKIVKEKGGEIWVESDGRGTKFVFTWPGHEIVRTKKGNTVQ